MKHVYCISGQNKYRYPSKARKHVYFIWQLKREFKSNNKIKQGINNLSMYGCVQFIEGNYIASMLKYLYKLKKRKQKDNKYMGGTKTN